MIENNDKKIVEKVNIQWYPGHMTKALRMMEDTIKQVDMVIEIRDARAIVSSQNPVVKQLRHNKPTMIIVSKKDKVSSIDLAKWEKHFTDNEIIGVFLDLNNDKYKNVIVNLVKKAMEPIHQKQLKRGIRPRATRAMVVGIPNVGKSTFINQMRQKNVLRVADTPGVTRTLSFINVSKELELVDTPGMLWPKFESVELSYHLALIGSISENVLPLEILSEYAFNYLKNNYKVQFMEYTNDIADFKQYIEKTARDRGFYQGSNLDITKAHLSFIRDIRDSKIKVCWERYDD